MSGGYYDEKRVGLVEKWIEENEENEMKDERIKIQKRIENMRGFYSKVGTFIDELPDVIPEKNKESIKNAILGDKELKKLMDGIETHRPPRIFLIGRTGVGKSSLINALCGAYVASVSDTKSCTAKTQIFKCMDGDRTLMEICDTRGIAESESINSDISAEDMLINQINEFSPDVAILMLSCTHRDDVNKDVEFLKELAKSYQKLNRLRLPIVVVINKSDGMAPARVKKPEEYSQSKHDKIQEVVSYYKGIIVRAGLKIDEIIAVSSLIDWQTPDGIEISVEDIDNLPKKDIENLEIAFDGRYKIEELLNILEEAIQDFEAQMGLRMAARLSEVVRRLAKHLNTIFSGIAGTVALTPIPVSDIYVLLILQAVLVTMIAMLSGRDISLESAKEFVFSMGGVAGLGYSLKLFAQQAVKLLNGIWPGAGSAVSSIIATAGTGAMGNAAIRYYIDGKGMDEVKKIFDLEKR